MSREIKFRAWDTVNKKYLSIESMLISKGNYVAAVQTEDFTMPLSVQTPATPDGQVILEQYTGIKDVEDTELFQGDILTNISGLKWVVSWDKNYAEFTLSYVTGEGSCSMINGWILNTKMTKIGNIHENPELLEVQE